MSDAYNVRSNGDRYYVYRIDGNVPVAEFIGPGAAAKAQRETAIRNQQHNEQFGKKKEQPEQLSSETPLGEVQTKPYPVPSKTPTPPQAPKSSQAPDPPPGQGTSY
jgi:hypothetical protein